MVYSVDRTEDLSPGHSISDCSEGPLQRGKGGARIYKSFCNKIQVVRTSKCYRALKKSRHRELMNLELFYGWKDARVWAY